MLDKIVEIVIPVCMMAMAVLSVLSMTTCLIWGVYELNRHIRRK
jgi:hypothetical protein